MKWNGVILFPGTTTPVACETPGLRPDMYPMFIMIITVNMVNAVEKKKIIKQLKVHVHSYTCRSFCKYWKNSDLIL